MKPSSGPRGILYVLTNGGMERFDLETKESISLFSNLFRFPTQLNHLGYFKSLRRLVFFDDGDDFPPKQIQFLAADPVTGEARPLFHLDRSLGLQAVSYSPDERWLAFLGGPKGFKRTHPDAPSPPDELWIRSFLSGEETLLAKDASPPGPPRFGFRIVCYSI